MYITLIFFFRAQDSLTMISSITSVYLPCSIKEFLRSIRDFSTSERSSFVRYIWYFGVLIKSLPSAIIICQKLSSLNYTMNFRHAKSSILNTNAWHRKIFYYSVFCSQFCMAFYVDFH